MRLDRPMFGAMPITHCISDYNIHCQPPGLDIVVGVIERYRVTSGQLPCIFKTMTMHKDVSVALVRDDEAKALVITLTAHNT